MSNDADIHDMDNTYTWGASKNVSPYTMNGAMVTTFLAALNAGSGFAGHTDWRIPNVNELQSILDYQNAVPTVSSAFNSACVPGCSVTTCSCTQGATHWSSTTFQSGPSIAWYVNFVVGTVDYAGVSKADSYYIRAVRGGS